MSKEIYKDVKGYEGMYQVSNLGNIKSLKFGKERILKTSIDNLGYYHVRLSKKGFKKTLKVHKLVAIAFLNHKQCNYKLVIDHKNNIKTDNTIKNLQIITHRKNCSKDRKNGSSKYIGVCFYKERNKWLSRIKINKKSKHLGYFDCELKAAVAYQNELSELQKNKI